MMNPGKDICGKNEGGVWRYRHLSTNPSGLDHSPAHSPTPGPHWRPSPPVLSFAFCYGPLEYMIAAPPRCFDENGQK
jgi:hypothetical protein